MTTDAIVDQKIDKHEEDCEKNFQKSVVTYRNALSLLLGAFIAGCSIVFYISDRFGKVETRISTIEVQTNYIADKIDKVIENQGTMRTTETQSTAKIIETAKASK
jgi:hypothetical protein